MDRDKLNAQLVLHEDIKLSAYRDSLGYWTIGVGRLIDANKGGRISEDEALYLLSNDVDRVVTQLTDSLPWWTSLDDVRQRVLADMCFNLGVGGLLKFKRTLGHVQAGRWPEAAEGMLASLWAKQVKGRATRLATMMRTGADA